MIDSGKNGMKINVNYCSLYYRHTCPFSQKVLDEIKQLRLEVELRNISLDENYQQELVQRGGLQQVPCLLIETDNESERWLYESAEIISYLRHQVAMVSDSQ